LRVAVPPDAAELITRLARMKRLLDELEREVSKSVHQTDMCDRLRREIEATRLALKLPGR